MTPVISGQMMMSVHHSDFMLHKFVGAFRGCLSQIFDFD